MKNIRHEIAMWAQAIAFIGIWVALLYFSESGPLLGPAAFSKIPDVVLIYSILYLVFVNWAWRWRGFQGWLVPFPDLQGTWTGTLQTTWKDDAGNTPGPIPVTVVIRQSFAGITCQMFSGESSSVSTAASFHADDANGVRRLSYVYVNTPKVSVRDRSVVHQGAVELTLASGTPSRLTGEYWTNRKSTGEMTLTFRDRNLDERLDG